MKLLALIILFASLLHAASSEEYRVRESATALELMTPYGMKAILGDYLPEGNDSYRIEIPIDELKPLPGLVSEPPEVKKGKDSKQSKSEENEEEEEEGEDEAKKSTKEKATKEPAIAEPETTKVTVQYDETDRLVLETNRLYNRGKFYEATAVVEELLRRKPTYVRGWIMKGSLMHIQKHKDLAKKAWQQALALEPNNTEIKDILEKFK